MRNKAIKIRVSDSELDRLTAKKSRYHLARWMREYCLAETKQSASPVNINRELVRQIAAIGNNLNQIARQVNSGNVGSPILVIKELRAVKAALDYVNQVHAKR